MKVNIWIKTCTHSVMRGVILTGYICGEALLVIVVWDFVDEVFYLFLTLNNHLLLKIYLHRILILLKFLLNCWSSLHNWSDCFSNSQICFWLVSSRHITHGLISSHIWIRPHIRCLILFIQLNFAIEPSFFGFNICIYLTVLLNEVLAGLYCRLLTFRNCAWQSNSWGKGWLVSLLRNILIPLLYKSAYLYGSSDRCFWLRFIVMVFEVCYFYAQFLWGEWHWHQHSGTDGRCVALKC